MLSFTFASLFASSSIVAAQLASESFTWGALPYQADTTDGDRGPQSGYNICNSTTEGPNALCQTAVINSLDDFCLWAPPSPGQTIGEIEGQMVSWCTQPGHGGRLIPDGTLTGVQFTKAPDYIQIVGYLDQTKIDMVAGDEGGEMDPHGADGRGNPIGGLVFSNAWTGTEIQAVQWNDFMGGNYFCFKACDPRNPSAADLCNNIYDTQGCGFNSPSNAQDGVFVSCASDDQAAPGVGAAVAPASSLCSTYASTAIYGASATVTVPVPGASTISFSSIYRPKSTASSKSVASSATKTSSSSIPSKTSAAMRLDAGIAGIIAAVFSAMLVA